ncbi:hypothetical protein ACCS93_38225 [Rhizobium ruizarguesonis]
MLRYIASPEIRQTIRAETTRIDPSMISSTGLPSAGLIIKSGDPIEQEKQLKQKQKPRHLRSRKTPYGF